MSKKKLSDAKNLQATVRRKWGWEEDEKDEILRSPQTTQSLRSTQDDKADMKSLSALSNGKKMSQYQMTYGIREVDEEVRSQMSDVRSDGKRYFFEMDEGTELEGIRKNLFLDRYSMKDENGEPMELYPEQMWKRLAKALAQEERTPELRQEWEERFYSAMKNFRFCPAGRFLTSAGTGTETTMINCFVIPNPEDTRDGIINTLKQVTEISARGGGVGFNLSSLRPRGSYLKSVNGTSSGAVSWANIYSVAAHDIIQQGGTRRGALMMMLWDWHPDVEEFITVKKEQGKILGANLSVCISDAFMEAVKEDKDWELKFPDTESEEYRTEWDGDLEEWMKKGYPVKVYKTIKAKDLWNLICESAWGSAEPGVIFMDHANKMNNTWYFEKNISTNPCAEQHLPAWGVCNLSSINLSALVDENGNFDWEDFRELIKVGVRWLDNAVDGENYLYKEIEDRQMDERRIGLGTLGLADALIKMKIRYGSDESLGMIEKIYKTLRDVAYEYSVELAKEKGKFPKFEADKYLESGFMKKMPEGIRSQVREFGIRNALVLTEAPTGKISLLAGASSGIEPVFSFSYEQKDRLGSRTMYHSLYKAWIDENGEEDVPDYFVVADDLTPAEHVKIQALIQKYTDSSISKTVNAPEVHTVEDVKELYRLAYETGCKGISYMREGSREGTLVRNNKSQITNDKPKEGEHEGNGVEEHPLVWVRPAKVTGATYKMETPMGRAFITVNHDDDGSPVEMFINIGRAGSDVLAMAEALGRLISKTLSLSAHLSSKERALLIVEQLSGIAGARSVGFGSKKIASLPDAVAKALAMDMGLIGFAEQNQSEITNNKLQSTNSDVESVQLSIGGDGKPLVSVAAAKMGMKLADICPDCGNATLVNEMGCRTCHGCGYSEC